MSLAFYIIKTNYIDYLRADPKLAHVFDNKENEFSHTWKYLGVVFSIGKYQYYAPLSSPKQNDYKIENSTRVIRKSIIPIIRIVSYGKDRKPELKGTLRLSSMIPVPAQLLSYYDIAQERDKNYKIWIEKEYDFIRRNERLIIGNAKVLYKQKTRENILYANGAKRPGYLSSTIDFRYAELLHDKYVSEELTRV